MNREQQERLMFKRLMNERNELRKYIIDICNLLYIDTSQSVLGANCLEFYAVLCSTAENKIKDLQEQLKRKEQECELLKEDEKYLLNVIDHLQKQKNEWEEKYNDLGQDFDQLKAKEQALDEIEEIAKHNNFLVRDPFCGPGYRDLSGQILSIIKEAEE